MSYQSGARLWTKSQSALLYLTMTTMTPEQAIRFHSLREVLALAAGGYFAPLMPLEHELVEAFAAAPSNRPTEKVTEVIVAK